MFVTTDADCKQSQLTDRDNSVLEQNSQVAVTDDCCMMDRRTDAQYSRMSAHALTPGVHCVTPVGSSLQTPFDGCMSASQHYNMLYSPNFHPRDAGHFCPPSHILNPMSAGTHCMPEATPFQAIANQLDNGYSVPPNSVAAPRPCSWHVSPRKSHHGVVGDAGVGKTPSFRRTPGARRPNIGSSPRVPQNCQQSLVVPRPLFQPSSCVRTGLSCGTSTGVLVRECSENDLRRSRSASSASSASARSRSATECTWFDAGGSVASGVELVVSNLDYNISSHEWKKILTCELQQQVQVSLQTVPL